MLILALSATLLVACNYQNVTCGLTKLVTACLIVCSCSAEMYCKIKFGHLRKFPCFLQRDAACSPDSRRSGQYRDLERKPRTPVSTRMNLGSASGLRCCWASTLPAPPCVWLDPTATVPQPEIVVLCVLLKAVVCVCVCVCVFMACHQNAEQICAIMMANINLSTVWRSSFENDNNEPKLHPRRSLE
jgi:hypothetical protein